MRVFFEHIGRIILMIRGGLRRPENLKVYWIELMDQCVSIGVGSLPIVLVISTFMGMVMTVQFGYQLISPLVPKSVIGSLVRDSSVLEFCPTVTSIILAGVIGSKISSELGNMRLSEQIDALEIMGINTKAYLVIPKILTCIIMIPCLIIISIAVSIWGGYIASLHSAVLTGDQYYLGVTAGFHPYDLLYAMAKTFTFSLFISIIPAYFGYYLTGGAVEIGRAATKSVVVTCILILCADYVLSILFL
jgi:phospholipid/cholesterol/gamma-HCH transport system permease protein